MAAQVLMAFAISVTMLANDDAGTPEARIVHNEILSFEDCSRWQDDMRIAKTRAVDPITGRKVASQSYECVPIRPAELSATLQRAEERYR